MGYRIIIPTAGIGSRLGHLTKYINKSLVSVSYRPALCHLIEQFPDDCEFVVALGYKGHLVREFIEIAYPNRKFYFARVNPFEGKNSGLGYSLLCCEQYLQEPFVFLSCDTLVKEIIPPPDRDWIGYANTDKLSSYRTVSVNNQSLTGIFEKGDLSEDLHYAYIGLAGIKSYAEFWLAMHQDACCAYDQGEAYGLRSLLARKQLDAHLFTWFDTGTPNGLKQTNLEYSQQNDLNILEKENEAIWFVDNQVIKFSGDVNFIENRVKRSLLLSGFVPPILSRSAHMYKYEKVDGTVLSSSVSLPLFKNFLNHAKKFWELVDLKSLDFSSFQLQCKAFYYDKTLQRVELFYRNFDKKDGTERVNDEPMPSLSSLLDQVDWDWISSGLPGRFHGDFHFENILWNTQSETFTFLDWRQDFGGDLEVGDIYYDLAKLLHGLIVSHELITKDAYSVKWEKDSIRFDLHRKQVLVECEQYFMVWCDNNGFDSTKVRLLTALIYLNIAALHHHPYSLLLYALGKSMLNHQMEIQ